MVRLYPAAASQKALSGDSLTQLFSQSVTLGLCSLSRFYKKLSMKEDASRLPPSKGDQYPHPCQGAICQATAQIEAGTSEQKD